MATRAPYTSIHWSYISTQARYIATRAPNIVTQVSYIAKQASYVLTQVTYIAIILLYILLYIIIIKTLNPKKAHGWDEISIRMIQMASHSITKPLSIIYKNCMNKGIFPDKWKRANVIPIHKKDKIM